MQGCRVSVTGSQRFLGGVGFLATLGVRVGVGFFVLLWIKKSNWIIFCITLKSWEFLLKRYNFLWKFCLKQSILALYHHFYWVLDATNLLTAKLHPLILRSQKFWKGQSWSQTFYLPLPNAAYKWDTTKINSAGSTSSSEFTDSSEWMEALLTE